MIISKKILLVLIGFFFCLCTLAQSNQNRDCSFIKSVSITYYINLVHVYADSQNLDCFCRMSDSLLYWSGRNPFYLAVLDSIFKISDGALGEYGDIVFEKLYYSKFETFANYILSHKKSFFIDIYENYAYNMIDNSGEDTLKNRTNFINNRDEKIDSLKFSVIKKQELKNLLKIQYEFFR